jgi:uncharacterized membrane protein YbjE (DUF340 family)
MYIILASLVCGILSGYFILPSGIISNLDKIASFALNLLILSVGIDLGTNKEVFYSIRETGFKILLIPASIIFGSLFGGAIATLIYGMPMNLGLAISSGFGWYSLSGVILSNISSPEAGTIAFLTNVFRELIAVLTIPLLAKKLNHLTAISPAGATSMDTTLPLISEVTDSNTVVVSFINGAILSSLVPILVPLLYNLK